FFVFPALLTAANPALAAAQKKAQVAITANPAECSFQGSPIARDIDFTSSCDIAKRTLTQAYIPYANAGGTGPATITIGDKKITAPTATLNEARHGFSAESSKQIADFRKQVTDAAKA